MAENDKTVSIIRSAYNLVGDSDFLKSVATLPQNDFVAKGVDKETGKISGPDNFGLISDYYKTFWIRIPKCANSFVDFNVHGIMRPINFNDDYDKFAKFSDYRGCAIIRDPFQRWLSGAKTFYKTAISIGDSQFAEIDEYAFHALVKNKFLAYNLIEFLFANLLTNHHGLLQSYFLYPCDTRNIDFFYLNENTGVHLNSWFLSNGVYNTLNNIKVNVSEDDYFSKFLNMFFLDSYNEKYKTKIIKSLQLDYDLIDTLHFYNRR